MSDATRNWFNENALRFVLGILLAFVGWWVTDMRAKVDKVESKIDQLIETTQVLLQERSATTTRLNVHDQQIGDHSNRLRELEQRAWRAGQN